LSSVVYRLPFIVWSFLKSQTNTSPGPKKRSHVNGIQNAPPVGGWASAFGRFGEHRLEVSPLGIGKAGFVDGVFHAPTEAPLKMSRQTPSRMSTHPSTFISRPIKKPIIQTHSYARNADSFPASTTRAPPPPGSAPAVLFPGNPCVPPARPHPAPISVETLFRESSPISPSFSLAFNPFIHYKRRRSKMDGGQSAYRCHIV